MSSPGIPEALGLDGRRCVALVGGGGKTTLMFALARAAAAAGRHVVTTTTTRILVPTPAESGLVLTGLSGAALAERLRSERTGARHVTVAASLEPASGKLRGLDPAEVDRLVGGRLADLVLVEADGAAGRPLKAHREDEPVVPGAADLVVAVVGVGCVGAPLDDAHVHRAALLAARLGLPAGAAVRAEDVAAIVLHPEGYLARVPAGAEVAVFLNQATGPAGEDAARRIAAALRGLDRTGRVGRILAGDARAGTCDA